MHYFYFVLRNILSRIRILKSREQTTNKDIYFYTSTSPLHYQPASDFLSHSLDCLSVNCYKCFKQKVPLKNYNNGGLVLFGFFFVWLVCFFTFP